MPDITSLMTPEEVSQKLHGVVSAERLIELAESQLLPHYTVDGDIALGYSETKEWLNHNLVTRHQGRHLGDGVIRIVDVVRVAASDTPPPVSLRAMAASLIPLSIQSEETIGCSGVYFLCHLGEVVYVGQSVNVFGRVGAHIGDKTFDSAFFARVPRSDLDYVEGALIRSLEPKYNRGKDGRIIAPSGLRGPEPSPETASMVSPMCDAGVKSKSSGRPRAALR
jgi:hypothetical protein